MIIRARPSKTFLYQHFAEDMQLSCGKQWGADIACAKLKNRDFFQTQEYLGVDLRAEAFALVSRRHRQGNVHSLVCDLRELALKKQSLDFLVSTHTLSHLNPGERLPSLASFVARLRRGGDLIFNIPFTDQELEDEIDRVLTPSFASVKKVRYRNFISCWYEMRLADSEGRFTFEGHGFAGRKALAAGSLLISFLEYIPILQKTGNMLYYCARGKFE